MWLFCVILSFFYILIIVHLGESHMLCRKSFLRITQIMTSIPPFAKWKKTCILTKFIGIFQTRNNNRHIYIGFYSIIWLKTVLDSKHNVARWTQNSRQRWRLFHSYSVTNRCGWKIFPRSFVGEGGGICQFEDKLYRYSKTEWCAQAKRVIRGWFPGSPWGSRNLSSFLCFSRVWKMECW